MSIKSKVKSAAKKVVSKAKEVIKKVSGTSQTGAASMSFKVGEGLSPSQKTSAQVQLSKYTGTPAQTKYTPTAADKAKAIPQKSGLMTYNTSDGKAPRPDGSNVMTKRSSGGSTKNTLTGGTQDSSNVIISPYSTSLTRASAPSSAGSISSFGSISSPSSNMGVGNIGPAQGSLAGVKSQNESDIQVKTAEQQALDDAKLNLAKGEEKNKSFLDQFMRQEKRQDTISEKRVDLQEEYNIKAQTAAIDELTRQYNETKVAAENQVIAAQDRLGTNNFINNQVQQIERNSAPILNRLSAEINFKTAILTRDEGLIQQAIDDYTAEKKDRWDMFKTFYSINQDTIDRLDSKYKDALSSAEKIAERDYKESREDRKMVADLAMDNPRAGIRITDSLEEATNKVISSGGSLEARREARLGSESSGSSTNSFLDVIQAAVNAGATPEEAAREAAIAAENSGIQVNLSTLSQWTDQARSLTNNQPTQEVTSSNSTVSEAERANAISNLQFGVDSSPEATAFFSNLFGR